VLATTQNRKKKKTSSGGTKGKEASKKTAKLLISQLCYNLLHHICSENPALLEP
jgi:hypothetical protein